jgi:hypothetical protein
VGRMERSVTSAGDEIAFPLRQRKGHTSDLSQLFRPVPGLGASHLLFPMAYAMGYFLSPSGLGIAKKSHRSAWLGNFSAKNRELPDFSPPTSDF